MSEAGSNGVQRIAEAYIKATYEGDVVVLRELFHKTAVMNGFLGGQLVIGSPEPFFSQLEGNPSLKSAGAPYQAKIEHSHCSGKIGSVTIAETGFGDMSFTNYLHLLFADGKWTIVSKTFESS